MTRKTKQIAPRSLPARSVVAITVVVVVLLHRAPLFANQHDDESSSTTSSVQIPAPEKLREMAIKESLRPVRPGVPGKIPFWNQYAQRFIYAPAFDFQPNERADEYRFTVTAESTTGESTDTRLLFTSANPWDDLGPIWKDIPIGPVKLSVEAIRVGKTIGISGEREFYKASPYRGPYHKRSTSYSDSVGKLLRYLYTQPYIQHWLTDGIPDPDYGLYCYPSKMYPAVVRGMLMFADVTQDKQERRNAIKIARIVADRLISLSQPDGKPLEYFPPTYTDRIYADIHDEWRGEDLSDRIMMVYPAGAARAYLDLFQYTKDRRYVRAAVRIASTYKKTQNENGTWPLLLSISDGRPVANNTLVPTRLVEFFHRLKSEHGISGYETCSQRAVEFIEANVARDFNWEGQFEDQKPAERYKNLSKGQAVAYALRLLKADDSDPEKLAEAEEIIRFAEDQFVIWESPNPSFGNQDRKSANWLLPCALEQYNFYVPVNASAAIMIEAFRMAYEKTGNVLYLAKSMDLANSIVAAQNKESGHYPTYMINTLLWTEGWINCMTGAASTVADLDEYLQEIKAEY